jgi:hypothetical protein
MKKILRAILFLALVGCFILATQISCQKSNAQTSSTSTLSSPGLILYDQQVTASVTVPLDSGRTENVTVYSRQYYIANIDGSNPRQIPITLPSGLYTQSGGRLTVDGKTLVFPVGNQSGAQQALYSCVVDGSSLKQIMTGTSTLEGAY